jgi:hypothetical protein
MSDLRNAAEQALEALGEIEWSNNSQWQSDRAREAITALHAALEQPERTLTDEKIAELWHQNGGFHHHFARSIERYLKG